MTSPARAIPSPARRPPLFLIAERELCPRMMAGMPARIEKKVTDKTPRIKLAVAFPSVAGITDEPKGVCDELRGWATVCLGVPQLGQNGALPGRFPPHLLQNIWPSPDVAMCEKKY